VLGVKVKSERGPERIIQNKRGSLRVKQTKRIIQEGGG